MTIHKIKVYPDPHLREACSPVTDFGDSLKTLVDDMAETMYNYHGVGLAAPQIGILKQVFILDLSGEEKGKVDVYINTEITSVSPEKSVCTEGCLSFPGLTFPIARPHEVWGKAQGLDGEWREFHWDGLEAVGSIHEWEHTQGKLMITCHA